uniref:MAGE domain-containing protein n=1 Tax=Varanus komodoensis TaxID=61221 RepID=A0A8D2J5Y6_VARKO
DNFFEILQHANETLQQKWLIYLCLGTMYHLNSRRIGLMKGPFRCCSDFFPLLSQVFGLELVKLDPKNHTYILISKLPPLEGGIMTEAMDKEDKEKLCPKLGLLIVILSLIYMKGNVAKESAVWEMLRRLRVDCSGEKHSIFGDVKKLVTEEFVRQKYLEYTRIPHTDPREFEFKWGPRATKETSKKQILQFVAKIQNKNPTFWMSQYNEAEAEADAAVNK